MGIYKNDYIKDEDPMMWELHEIRNKMAQDRISIEKINQDAEKIISRYKLNNMKFIQNTQNTIQS